MNSCCLLFDTQRETGKRSVCLCANNNTTLLLREQHLGFRTFTCYGVFIVFPLLLHINDLSWTRTDPVVVTIQHLGWKHWIIHQKQVSVHHAALSLFPLEFDVTSFSDKTRFVKLTSCWAVFPHDSLHNDAVCSFFFFFLITSWTVFGDVVGALLSFFHLHVELEETKYDY